jgi:type IV secretory pathway VirB10-like protein
MLSNRLAFAALGIACVTAAAAGGYVATRHNAAVPAASTTSGDSSVATPTSAVATPDEPVQKTEAAMGKGRGQQVEAAPARASRDMASRPAERPIAARSATNWAGTPLPTPERASQASSGSAPVPAPEPAPSVATVVDAGQPAARDEDARVPETPRAPDPPARTVAELVVSEGSVVGLQMETAVSSERARVEDRVEARVVRDVRVGGTVAIPAGSRAIGSVMVVERGGKVKDRARLGIRFHTLVLADGTRLPITTETMYRQGDPPGNTSAAKIGGGAAAGAILGAIIGGGKGAAIGSTIGAGAGTASVMSGDRNAATFPAGTDVTARILSPVTVTVEK